MKVILPLFILIAIAIKWHGHINLFPKWKFGIIGVVLIAGIIVMVVVTNRKNGTVKKVVEVNTQQTTDEALVHQAHKLKELTGETPVTDFKEKSNTTKKFIYYLFNKKEIEP